MSRRIASSSGLVVLLLLATVLVFSFDCIFGAAPLDQSPTDNTGRIDGRGRGLNVPIRFVRKQRESLDGMDLVDLSADKYQNDVGEERPDRKDADTLSSFCRIDSKKSVPLLPWKRLPGSAMTVSEEARKKSRWGRATLDFGVQSTARVQLSFRGHEATEVIPVDERAAGDFGSGDHGRVDKNNTDLPSKKVTPLERMSVTVDPASAARLGQILFAGSASLVSAFMGTLRLLAPLIIARRGILTIGEFFLDYLRGRYFRKTYTRLERYYLRYVEAPAVLRALCRTASQISVLFALSKVMGWMVGITHPPCRSAGRGLAFFCGVLWLGAVIGVGHAFATAVAVWGGPLRIQADRPPQRRTSVSKIFTRPWHILQWMQDPEEWISMISTPEVHQPFDPNAIIFPMTWISLRLLQMFSVAKVLSTEPPGYKWCSADVDQVPRLMKQFLVQFALVDEWYRVFLGEKRVGLGICVVVCCGFAMLAMIVTSARITGFPTLFMMPSFLAVIVSGWMNIVIFWNRMEFRRKQATISPYEQRKQMAMNVIKMPPM